MSFRTNRRTRGIFKLGAKDPAPPAEGTIIKDAPDIVGFDNAGSVYVEDGSGERYIVKYADGHTAEVEMRDYFSPSDDPEEEGESDKEWYTMSVVWDGAVDFEESYDGNDEESRKDITRRLIERYGRIAEDFTGVKASSFTQPTRETRMTATKGLVESEDDDEGLVGKGETVFSDDEKGGSIL